MSEPSIFEPYIVKAFENSGWEVLERAYPLRLGEKDSDTVDLFLRRADDPTHEILVLVFPSDTLRPREHELFKRVTYILGKYMVFESARELLHMHMPLYVAIPLHVYDLIFDRLGIGWEVMNEREMQRIIVDMDAEKVARWIEF